MYSPDQADIDPRNPANQEDRIADRFLIDVGQFSDEQSELLANVDTIDHVFDNESDVRDAAFTIARLINEPIHIDCGAGVKGDYDWFDYIIVRPEVKVA